MLENKPLSGYFKVKNNTEEFMIALNRTELVLIDFSNNALVFGKIEDHKDIISRFKKSNPQSISYNEFYKEYKNILKFTDDFLGVRGKLIEPGDIDDRVETDHLGRLNLIF